MKVEVLSSLLLASSVLSLRSSPHREPRVKDLKTFKAHSHEVLEGIHRLNRSPAAKSAYFSAVFKHLTSAGQSSRVRNQTAVSEFFKCLSNEDIEKYGSYMVGAFGLWMDAVKNEAKARKVITRSQRSLIDAIGSFASRKDKRDLRAINPEWLKEGGTRMMRVLQKRDRRVRNSKPLLAEMPASFWSWIAARPAAEQEGLCGVISASTFSMLVKESAPKISASCFAAIKNVGSADIALLIPKMSDNVFKYFTSRVSAKNVKAMKPAQIAGFNTDSPADARCQKLSLHGATKEGIKAATGACLASYLLSGNSRALGPLWSHISKDIFDSLGGSSYEFEYSEIARAIDYNDKVHIPFETLTKFLTYPGFAENFTADGELKLKGGVLKIAPKDLPQLKDKNIFVAALLSNDPLDPMFLAYLDADFFTGIEYPLHGKHYEELRVLDLIKASNKAEVIKNLSANIDNGQHACSLIKTVDNFKAVKALEFADAACIAELTFDMDLNDYKKMPALLRGRSFKTISKHLSDDDFLRMPEPFFAALLTGDFCSVVGYKRFAKINPDALSAVHSDCVSKFDGKLIAKLTPEQTIRFADDAFETITASQWKQAFTIKHLNEKQIPRLSAAVKNDKEVATSAFTDADITTLGKQVSLLTARQVAVLSDKALLAAPIANLTASSLTLLSLAKVKLLISTFPYMSAAQIENLGASSTDVTEILLFIEENKSKLNKEAFAAWEKRRLSGNSAKTMSTGVTTAVALGLVAAILL
ncbi:hypothetical protein PSACC_03220 [Paramicrosporidium saccamoebae]|uniref:Uncharacterized protein n=1 Tax=Paramicrosporidium saccamoebae TaxID=1246581 RepID=A0A2H9TGY2_9FUNG|nr:hypothetical protein PSACC_03220 [Paramicrosporidium saccamoebae]